MTTTRISVLCPTRGRWEKLVVSMTSLLDKADTPGQVEILLAVDPDEATEARRAYLESLPFVRLWVTPERYGYQHLEKYYNGLAERAQGDWLMLWNDDAIMQTRGWDIVVVRHEPALLFPGHNGPMHCNAFPVWPAEWTRWLGHVSLGAYVDTWMQGVAEMAGVQQRVPVELFHETPNDTTWQEGRARTPFGGPELAALMEYDSLMLRRHLREKLL